MVARLPTAMTDGSPCVCMCVFVFYFFIPRRSLSQAQSIQHHCLTTTFNPVRPTGLGCEGFDWSKDASLIHIHQMHKDSQHEVYGIIPPRCIRCVSEWEQWKAVSTDRRWKQLQWNSVWATAQFLDLMVKGTAWAWVGLVYILNVRGVLVYACQFCSWQNPGQAIVISLQDKKWL